MTRIISTPNQDGKDVSESNKQYGFGFYETQNATKRRTQEDALAWQTLTKEELTPVGSTTQLTPIEIGHRLWTSYKLLDKPTFKAGCTAITTVYDGMDNLITATLGDAAAFAIAYNHQGEVLGVLRLHRRVHEPSDPHESQRINKTTGFVVRNRVLGVLGVARALGDVDYKPFGVSSNADIDIISFKQLAESFNCHVAKMSTLQILTSCDGFTDGVGKSASKKAQEDYVFNALKSFMRPGLMKEKILARLLVLHALEQGSQDNVTVGVHTIRLIQPMMLSVFDGHGGIDAACHAAEYMGNTMKEQCQLPVAEYVAQPMSVDNNLVVYQEDNANAIDVQNQSTTSNTTTSSTSTASTVNPSPGKLKRSNAMTASVADTLPQSFFGATETWTEIPLDDEATNQTEKKRRTELG